MGYKILFKPHPRDTREYIVNPSVEILDIQLPLECYNLDICAVISFASSATLHLLTMQNMASFTIDLPIAKKGCKINENWISPLVKKMLLDYTTPISILIETNPSNLTKIELKKMLKNKCDNYINSLPKLSENKEFNKYAKELGFYVKR